jgi:Zn-dependent peptidase ImmA (M78 family)
MQVKYISDADLEKFAHSFLQKHGYLDSVPIDIERLCETAGVSVLPTDNLKTTLGIDAYITDSCSLIVIDKECFLEQIPRARFSMAHELSHKLLHEDLFKEAKVTNLAEYKAFRASLAPLNQRVEVQAYSLAGSLLMPKQLLNKELTKRISLYGNIEALTIGDAYDILNELLELFNVSEQAMRRQLPLVNPKFNQALYQIS